MLAGERAEYLEPRGISGLLLDAAGKRQLLE